MMIQRERVKMASRLGSLGNSMGEKSSITREDLELQVHIKVPCNGFTEFRDLASLRELK